MRDVEQQRKSVPAMEFVAPGPRSDLGDSLWRNVQRPRLRFSY